MKHYVANNVDKSAVNARVRALVLSVFGYADNGLSLKERVHMTATKLGLTPPRVNRYRWGEVKLIGAAEAAQIIRNSQRARELHERKLQAKLEDLRRDMAETDEWFGDYLQALGPADHQRDAPTEISADHVGVPSYARSGSRVLDGGGVGIF